MQRIELLEFDRDVRCAVAALETWRLAPIADRDPFAGLRHTATQTTYHTLLEHESHAGEELHRAALARWVHELIQARIGLDLEVDEHEAIFARDPTATEDADISTFAEGWERVIRGTDLDRAESLALPVAAVRRERRIRREEAMRRLSITEPTSALAQELLDATEPLAVALFQRARKAQDSRSRQWRATDAIELAHAKDAREGWPAQLGSRWLDEVFAPLGRAPTTHLNEALGGASFLRAAALWGFSRRVVGAPRALPFALARDPYSLPAHVFGCATSWALADPLFAKKVMGIPQRLAAAQARALRTSLFLGVRTIAGRVLAARGDVEEVTGRVFGAPMHAAFPSFRIDDHARVAAILTAYGFVGGLVDRFDEDWFANPKCGQHLAQIAAAPLFDDTRPPAGAASAIAKLFEELLG